MANIWHMTVAISLSWGASSVRLKAFWKSCTMTVLSRLPAQGHTSPGLFPRTVALTDPVGPSFVCRYSDSFFLLFFFTGIWAPNKKQCQQKQSGALLKFRRAFFQSLKGKQFQNSLDTSLCLCCLKPASAPDLLLISERVHAPINMFKVSKLCCQHSGSPWLTCCYGDRHNCPHGLSAGYQYNMPMGWPGTARPPHDSSSWCNRLDNCVCSHGQPTLQSNPAENSAASSFWYLWLIRGWEAFQDEWTHWRVWDLPRPEIEQWGQVRTLPVDSVTSVHWLGRDHGVETSGEGSFVMEDAGGCPRGCGCRGLSSYP